MARTYRNHPSYARTRRTCGDCGSSTCDYCLNNRLHSTRRALAAAADDLRTDFVCHVDERAEEAAIPTFASVDLIRQYDEEEADCWSDWDERCYQETERRLEDQWAKDCEIEWAWAERERQRELAAFDAERAWAWD
jgi:hypothetical protein